MRRGRVARVRRALSIGCEGEHCEKLVDLLCYYRGLWDRPRRSAHGRERQNLPAGGQYNVSAGSGESNRRLSLSGVRTVRERKSFRQAFPREGGARARSVARRPFDFAWAAQLGQSSDELNAYLHIIARETTRYRRTARWKSTPCDERTESSRQRTYYCANGIRGAVWWIIVEREILPNNFPWYVGSVAYSCDDSTHTREILASIVVKVAVAHRI